MIFTFPIWIGFFGGLFGLAAGLFGACIGIIAGVFGAVFGVLGSVFGIFDWPFPHIHISGFVIIAFVFLIVLISRSRRKN
jgi:hypothetical protein